MNTIDYHVLAQARACYAQKYAPIEVPWWASQEIINITRPPRATLYNVLSNDKAKNKALLASAEQGFLYLANKGQLPSGKYQAITPCFRDEPYDQYHSKQFMKLELISLLPPGTEVYQNHVTSIVRDAKKTFAQLLSSFLVFPPPKLKVVQTNIFDSIEVPETKQQDIVMVMPDGREIELGSYGARQTSFATWIYGTGVAEPRFSRAVNEANQLMRNA